MSNNTSDNTDRDNNTSDNTDNNADKDNNVVTGTVIPEQHDERYPMASTVNTTTYATIPNVSSLEIIQQRNQQDNEQTSENTQQDEEISYISPIQYTVSDLINEQVNVTPIMVKTYQYAGAVKYLAIMDIFIGFLYVIYLISPIGFFFVIFPLIGYYGSIKYDVYMTGIYFVYHFFIFTLNLFILYSFSVINNNQGENENEINPTFSILNICVNFYFLYLIKRYIDTLNEIPSEELFRLRFINFVGNNPRTLRFY